MQLHSLSWAGERQAARAGERQAARAGSVSPTGQVRNSQDPQIWASGQQESQARGDTYIALVGVEDFLVATEKNVTDAARALDGVCSGGKGKGQAVIRARELHLSQVMDEKIELCGHTAQARLNQPVGAGGRVKRMKNGDPDSRCRKARSLAPETERLGSHHFPGWALTERAPGTHLGHGIYSWDFSSKEEVY